jgi:uncharacterized membrane protein YwzB
MNNLFGLLIHILVGSLIFAVLWWLLQQIPLPEPFKMVATVLLALIAVVFLLGLLFGGVNLPHLRLR